MSVRLDQSWTVSQIKTTLAPKLQSPADSLRIIFAGKELPDDMVMRQCDLGNHSILHAVRVVSKEVERKGAVDPSEVGNTTSPLNSKENSGEGTNITQSEKEVSILYVCIFTMICYCICRSMLFFFSNPRIGFVCSTFL